MKITDFIWLPYSDSKEDYRDHIACAAIEENWGPKRKYLFDYVSDNFELAHAQGKIKEPADKAYFLFRIGTLSTRGGEPITMLAMKNRLPNKQPYVFSKIFTGNRFTIRLENSEVTEVAPSSPTYNIEPIHTDYNLVFNFDHYLKDHEERVSEKLPTLNSHQRFLCIYAALQLAYKRADLCAVKQWYCDKNADEGNYQWLLPLHISEENIDSKPDLIATLDPRKEYSEYYIRTVLPPEFSYGHARAISMRNPHFSSWA